MAEYALDDTFETSGRWFLPETPDRTIPGILRHSAKGIELQLDGAFWEMQNIFAHNLHTYPVIHGITREGDAVSLLRAHQAGVNMGFRASGGYISERLGASVLVMGAHIPPDFSFTKMRFRIPGLHYWLSRPVVERTHVTDEATGQVSWRYRLAHLDDLVTRIPSIEASIKWDIDCYETNILDPFAGINVTVSGWITLCPDTPQPLNWYLKQQAIVATLLGFLAGTPSSMDRIEGYSGSQPQPVSLLLAFGNRQVCTYAQHSDFFLPLNLIGIPLEEMICRWFDIYPAIEKPTELAQSVFASGRERLWLHLEFLAWMQALEGLQRALPAYVLPPVQPKRRNRPALRERLDALTSLLPSDLRLRILEEDVIPQSWIATRDYYTHWIEDLRKDVLDNTGLYDANVRAKHLSTVLYLTLAGIPTQSFAKAYEGTNKAAQELIGRNAFSAHKRDPNSKAGLMMAVHPAPGANHPPLDLPETQNATSEET